jgi:hypothetical protein
MAGTRWDSYNSRSISILNYGRSTVLHSKSGLRLKATVAVGRLRSDVGSSETDVPFYPHKLSSRSRGTTSEKDGSAVMLVIIGWHLAHQPEHRSDDYDARAARRSDCGV